VKRLLPLLLLLALPGCSDPDAERLWAGIHVYGKLPAEPWARVDRALRACRYQITDQPFDAADPNAVWASYDSRWHAITFRRAALRHGYALDGGRGVRIADVLLDEVAHSLRCGGPTTSEQHRWYRRARWLLYYSAVEAGITTPDLCAGAGDPDYWPTPPDWRTRYAVTWPK
jgi:hypothetical protein